MITAGIDAGSRTVKLVLYDHEAQEVLVSGVADTGPRPAERCRDLLDEIRLGAGLRAQAISACVATGYGRKLVDVADRTVTEITCHARGLAHLLPQARSLIEIGGQDSKVLHLDEAGRVRDFAMNDRCAAGTGRFLEVVAERLELDLDGMGRAALESDSPAPISSTCVVFAETEIIGLLARGRTVADVAAGVQQAIAQRVLAMTGALTAPVAFAGGVALVPGMKDALATAAGQPLTTAPQPQLTGALGAALMAGDA